LLPRSPVGFLRRHRLRPEARARVP
jgi:hypothetical protein